ncbi:uncharacterized protein CMU_008990 [Cryptosporidium muris RN66]|uniref:Uncharacterized protein n=1 Tax=Cryptosporidium muris (strain RN66) TaxID=441375 RepID=B6ADW6_CRYMR|nr:uncharacterized protein CMU_008990 [Cryptosporidium muris RN66]EEA06407.1 hypothetical protein CMU_008990 [Cryptosporidium muris RN66]|eukprot:XP_002140756.1 hypothetical protein [Cryptosporidium muris RN66]
MRTTNINNNTEKRISWNKYIHFSINISYRLKQLESQWNQPQSDISLIEWYIGRFILTQEIDNKQKESLINDYLDILSKVITDGIIHIVDSYNDPIDNKEIRLLKSDRLFFPQVWDCCDKSI